MRYSLRRIDAGVGFVELMVVLALIACLAMVGIPAFSNLIIKSRISAATTTLHAAFLLARAEAIKRGKNVVICRSVNSNGFNPSCASNGGDGGEGVGWADGWIIFVDEDSDKKYTARDGLVHVQAAIFNNPAEGAIIPTPNRGYLSFNPTGQTFASYIRFTIRRPDNDTNPAHDKYLCLASGGRVRVDTNMCISK
ncbi:GspH/FimT family pseudopilin [Undibacterium sp. Di24W]|uniref:GspH/FimT family pseudopilin n=1 Tax=Undibacterium sp. Di24W TaxID=3413033 RepID=UPI003BF2A0A3